MNKLKEINKIKELINKNKMLLNVLIGYCKHDVYTTEEIANVLSALEIILEQHIMLKDALDKFYMNYSKD